MAALPDRYAGSPMPGSLIDLRDLQPEHLAPLLDQEIEAWKSGLDWDFRASADLVKRFVQVRALNGFALVEGGVGVAQVAGYGYYVVEEGKGLIGDFFVRPSSRTAGSEYRLLEAVLEGMWRTPGIRRVEAQLMMLESYDARAVPFSRWFRRFPRQFMETPLRGLALSPSPPSGALISPWAGHYNEEAARLIAASYRGHIDSQINDQYRSPQGALRFLVNIVQYPGCGMFFAPASFAARDRRTGELCGISLASLIASDVGHITQICVTPPHQRSKLGYELMRRSMEALQAHRCRSVTLTVTTDNEVARSLYERMGFRNKRDFAAYVWDMA